MSMLALFESNVGSHLEDTPSPVTNWLNGKLTFVERGKIEIEYEVRKEMTNPLGLTHGGIISLIHDDLIGMCVITLDKEFPYTSVNITVDFLKGSKQGDKLIAVAEIIREGNKLIYVQSSVFKLFNDERILISKASSNMLKFS